MSLFLIFHSAPHVYSERTYLKECECASGFSSLDLDFTSIYAFWMLESTWRVSGEYFTLWDIFLWIDMESSTVNCWEWCCDVQRSAVHTLLSSLLTLFGDLWWRTEGLSCFWHELYLPSDLSIWSWFLLSLIQWVMMVVTYPAWEITFYESTLNNTRINIFVFVKFHSPSVHFLSLLLLHSGLQGRWSPSQLL